VPVPQLVPHDPQLLLSVCVLTQVPLQSISPAPVHISASGGASTRASAGASSPAS
jgi:hypothetical protein